MKLCISHFSIFKSLILIKDSMIKNNELIISLSVLLPSYLHGIAKEDYSVPWCWIKSVFLCKNELSEPSTLFSAEVFDLRQWLVGFFCNPNLAFIMS